MNKNYIGISRDHSASMRPLTDAAAQDYNSTINVIREQATTAGQDTIVSVVRSGCGSKGAVVRETTNSSISALAPINTREYVADGNSTPLFDSIGDLIEQLESVPDAADTSTSFLVMAITDGEENSSRKWTASRLMAKIQQLQRTDRWTFVFRVPRGYAQRLSTQFGIPLGNILEWETTARGLEESTVATRAAFTQYYSGLKSGVTSTAKFYTNLTNVSVGDIKANLTDISSRINLWVTTQKESIRPFCEKMSGKSFIKGAAFYQLTKTEPEVQDYKKIVIRDKVSGAVYGGAAARQLLNLPAHGNAYVKPGDHGQFDIYIQSTSVNRVLPPGTQLLYWPTHDESLPTLVAPPKAVVPKTLKVVAPVRSNLHTQGYISGYKVGFPLGKAKSPNVVAPAGLGSTADFSAGYAAGYKDGRGKKKQIYK